MVEINAIQSKADIDKLCKVASSIWYKHYAPIIGKEQVAYMLDKFQSPSIVAQQIKEDDYFYYSVLSGKDYLGYFAVQQRNLNLFISKFYLVAAARGKGVGKTMLHFIKEIASEKNIDTLQLTVNKYNTGSIKFYEKCGFTRDSEAVFDIGNGYVMDDYVYSKSLIKNHD